MKALFILIFAFFITGCNDTPANSSVKDTKDQISEKTFWEYLSKIPSPADTVREFSKYISNTHNITLESAYLRDRIFDSLLSPSKETRKYYFTISTSALRDMAMFDPNFNSNLCERIQIDPREIIELLNSRDSSTIEDIAVGIGLYFSNHVKNPKLEPEVKGLLSLTSKKMDSVSIANTKHFIFTLDQFLKNE